MVANVKTAAVIGLDTYEISVEVDEDPRAA